MTYDPRSHMFAKVILASQHPNSTPLYTVHMRYPRCIHAEPSTHRIMSIDGVVVETYEPNLGVMADKDLSRNARSSRAVPVKTMLEEVRNTPFIPWHWGANQKGMQAGAECNERLNLYVPAPELLKRAPGYVPFTRHEISREDAWLHARDAAVSVAEGMMNAGYHKQIVNRLLEPFSWIDTLVTTTSFSNFLWLREHKDTEPHLQDLAHMVTKAISTIDVIRELNPGEWHLPYFTADDIDHGLDIFDGINEFNDWARKISAARCARMSITPFDGDASYERELERYNLLVSGDRVHASPLEHQATPDIEWTSKHLDGSGPSGWEHPELHGNLTGWIQARKLVPGEYHA